jgi:type 1 fimbriae regulatory protein FimB
MLKTMSLKQPKTPRSRARKYSARDVQYLNEEELGALFRSIDSPRDLAIFEVAFHRGLRASEVGLLKVSGLRLSARRLYVDRLKGGNSAEYLLTDREIRALRKWMAIRGTAAGPLFLSREHGRISRTRLDQLMKHYGARAGLPESKRHFHCLRHSAGTLLSEKAQLEEVKDHLGHRDIRSTMKYVVVRSKRRDELGARLAKDW